MTSILSSHSVPPSPRRRRTARDLDGQHDWELRTPLLARLARSGTQAAVVEELVLPRDVRADVVQVGVLLHGYEIKAGCDTLTRLPKQAEAYAAAFDRCTIVTTEWHLPAVERLLPSFWGILVFVAGSVCDYLVPVRDASQHDLQCPDRLLQLLWHSELLAGLRGRSLPASQLRGTKDVLARTLNRVACKDEIRGLIADSLRSRARAQADERRRRDDADFALFLQQRRRVLTTASGAA